MVTHPTSDRKSENEPTSPAPVPQPPRRLALKLLLVAVVALLTGDVALRAVVFVRGWTPNCYAAQLQLFRPNPETGYDLQPGFRLRSSVYRISINSLGLRGP